MPRYIDADALEDQLGIEDEDIDFKHILDNAPTVSTVPVVRCKDCKHLETLYAGDTAIGHCDLGERETFGCEPDDYCSYGERKDGEK